MKKKVVIITEACGGGVRKHILDLLLNLDQNKYDLYFLYSLNRADDVLKSELDTLAKQNIQLIELKELYREISIKSDTKALIELFKVLKAISPDIVHCHSSKAGAIGRVIAKIIGVQQIYYTPHAYIMQNPNVGKAKKKVYSVIEAVLSRMFTTKNINVSYGEKEFAVKENIDKEDKFLVVYNGVEDINKKYDVTSLKNEIGIVDNDIVVGVTARLDEQKDPLTFVKIANDIIKKYDNVKFIYVGDGEYRSQIEEYINQNNLNDKVKLLGFRSDVEQVLQIFDIYMITSLYEGMPYSLIEALRCKLPIVATDTIGNNEVIEDSKNGYLFEVRNHEQGTDKLISLIEDKKLIEKMGENSYKLFKEKFTLEKMILDIEKLYDDRG